MGWSLGKILTVLHEDFLNDYVLVFIIESFDLFDKPFGIERLCGSISGLNLCFCFFLISSSLRLTRLIRAISAHMSLLPATETAPCDH
jgi:hypothetical protein